jgi:RluA family pseudouridine synthase
MESQKTENDGSLAGWPQVIEVWHFDRSKGCTNIGSHKKNKPCKVDQISVAIKEVYDKNCSYAPLCDKQAQILKHLPFSQIPQNFCKKDINTGWQKQLRCQACRCLMESTSALKCHLQSTKHTENFKAFVSGKNSSELSSTESKIDNINNCRNTKQPPIHEDIRKSQANDSNEVQQSRGSKRRKMETKGEKNKGINDRPGFGQDKYDETSYYFDPDKELRKVYPYYFTFTTYTKGRWVGEGILDVFTREFRAHTPEEYKKCIESGTLTVNGENVESDYKLQHNDMLANVVHRHEVPVTNNLIRIVYKDSDLIVVDKPPSIPVHPCGRYRYNTVVYILAKEHGLKFLKTIHRLDRLTSGILLLGRTSQKAHEMEQQIRSRSVRKEYVCRVEGDFLDTSTNSIGTENNYSDNAKSNVIICTLPIEVVSHKIGVCRVSEHGKPCKTEFERLSYNGKTSVVLCRPHTGRMHQIRVHLQYLGYPIVNDPLYNSSAFGPNKGKGGDIGGKTHQELINELIYLHSAESWIDCENETTEQAINSDLVLNKSYSIDGNKTNHKFLDENSATKMETDHGCENTQHTIMKRENSLIHNSSQNSNAVKTTNNADMKDSSTKAIDLKKSSSEGKTPVSSLNTDAIHVESTLSDNNQTFDEKKLIIDLNCKECSTSFSDPTKEDLVMYLHAYKYSGDSWSFETKLPEWANENWSKT